MNFLSPTSIKLFKEDRELFYLRYLAETRLPREPQTLAMAIGSAFDAFVKSYLHGCYYSDDNDDYKLENLFNKQVEEQNREEAWGLGQHIFEEYMKAGCLADLVIEMDKAVGPPRFEFEIKAEVNGVPLLGRPDIFFISEKGARVVYDWKVNGIVDSKGVKKDSATSPMKGYVGLKTKVDGTYFNCIYKDCVLKKWKGILINEKIYLEQVNEDWARQLAIYSWLLGEEIGSEEVIFGIDQVVGGTGMRFATHRLLISPDYQYNLIREIEEIWECIMKGEVVADPELLEASVTIKESILDGV